MRSAVDRSAKRLFDVVCSALGLLLLSPLLVALAAWVRIDSPGPALYRQPRVGRAGRLFRIHKFRTMRDDDAPAAARSPRDRGDDRGIERGPALTIGDDPRITRAGRFLRRTKLDELPQLIDVLAGDMSLVGPRPEVPHYVGLYPDATRAKVLSVRPGITDLASLRFRDESALLARAADPEREYREVVLPAKLALAVDYADHGSFWQDLRVLGLTLRTLLLFR